MPVFFHFVGERPGWTPWDPVIAGLAPMDLSTPLFAVLYVSVIVSVLRLMAEPLRLLRGAQAYVILLMLRMAAMALVPLEPPHDLIELVDPVTQVFYPGGRPFTKDLFFSGHTATVFLLYLVLPPGLWRWALAVVTLFVAAAVVLQHVHWTLDVLVALPAAWLAWRASACTLHWTAPDVRVSGGGA